MTFKVSALVLDNFNEFIEFYTAKNLASKGDILQHFVTK